MPVMRMCARYTGVIGLQQTTFFFFLQELEASLVCTGKRLDFKNINIHFSLALVVFVNKLNTSITKGALGSVPTGRQLLSSESILRIALFSICSC